MNSKKWIAISALTLLAGATVAQDPPRPQDPPRRGGGQGGKRKPPQDGIVKPSMSDTVHGSIYADNWFAMYINGKLVAVDSIDFLPHNVVSIDILPEYPMTIAVLAKDNADPQTGCEYGKQIGDGGFILKFADGTVTDAKWKGKCFFYGPIDRNTADPRFVPIRCRTVGRPLGLMTARGRRRLSIRRSASTPRSRSSRTISRVPSGFGLRTLILTTR